MVATTDRSDHDDATNRCLVTSRLLAASPARVFEVWSAPAHLEKWWGPRGFSTTTHAFEFRVGGAWVHTMHGPDGVDYPNRLVFEEIVPGERIVCFHRGDDAGDVVLFRNTITFEREGEGTRVTMRQVFATKQERERARKYKADEGSRETLERLAEHTVRTVWAFETKCDLTIVRTFQAPRARVFDAMTRVEHLAHWWGPKGLEGHDLRVDLRAGGAFSLGMRTPDGTIYPYDGVFEEVVPPERLVKVGAIHGDPQKRVRTTITFDERDGATTVTIHQQYATESVETAGAKEGWTTSLDKLDALLAR
ncbi:MAG: SRPBCC domain-containing protein [Polyangiales bacterium]